MLHQVKRIRTSCFTRILKKRTLLPVIVTMGIYLTVSPVLLYKDAVIGGNEFYTSRETTRPPLNKDIKQRIVILGAGPTGLGAAYRFYEQAISQTNTQVVILEQQAKPGGLAVSHRDSAGFLWDNGGHVVFSHYDYFTKLLDHAVSNWTKHKRAAYAFMKGSSGNRLFIPYPVQNNVPAMEKQDRERILKDLEKLINEQRNSAPKTSATFDEWLVNNFGNELSDTFMRKYNKKIWTVDPKEMNAVWVGERVATPDLKRMQKKRLKDSKWGPNYFFRFPRYNGTGGIWQGVSSLLPRHWFHYRHKVVAVDIEEKILTVEINNEETYKLTYDILITTSPLDVFVNMDQNKKFEQQRTLVNKLVYSTTNIIGIGLKGHPTKSLSDKSWIYFPDSDSPFYRATVFSKYSPDHAPNPESEWSLMCECAEPNTNKNNTLWTKYNVVQKTVDALIKYGFIKRTQILSRFYHRLHHGYPVPSVSREHVLSVIQPWLESNNVFSRGRFGGWRYEVGNQDHCLMQGVEIADFILKGIPEETYPKPTLVNSMKASKREFTKHSTSSPDYEIVLAHYNEDLSWIEKHAQYCHVYHKGKSKIPDFTFQKWETLPNVGRESHTYLHHIITNYDQLANITIFLQAGANDHNIYDDPYTYYHEAKQKGFSAKYCREMTEWGRIAFRGIWTNNTKKGPGSSLFRKSKFTLDEFWKDAFGTVHPNSITWCPKGNFAVTKAVIQKNPLSYYKKLINYIDDSPDPEEGHYFERFWRDGVFSILGRS